MEPPHSVRTLDPDDGGGFPPSDKNAKPDIAVRRGEITMQHRRADCRFGLDAKISEWGADIDLSAERPKPGGGELGNGDAVTRESDW
jgi:hypothetical protein